MKFEASSDIYKSFFIEAEDIFEAKQILFDKVGVTKAKKYKVKKADSYSNENDLYVEQHIKDYQRALKLLKELEEGLTSIIQTAEEFRKLVKKHDDRLASEVSSYLIPWMEAFRDNSSQPGSIISIKKRME